MQLPLLWADIDLAAIAHNMRELRRITDAKVKLMVAVKADGYGHGAIEVARAVLQNGATHLGVARLEEGIHLRRADIGAPILILGYTPAQCAAQLLTHHLMPTVYSLNNARNLAAAAEAHHQHLTIHIKVDTGMGRLGVPDDTLRLDDAGRAAADIAAITQLPGLELQGLYTHFATADHEDKTYARQQFAHFQKLLAVLNTNGQKIPLRHAANSGAIIDMSETHLDMVRAGISVYGLYPSREVNRSRIDLRPALQLKAKIIHLKEVPAHTKISYGGTFETTAPTTIATIPVGYGDGYSRLLSNRGHMLVRGRRAPIAGRICMDLTMLDVGHIDHVQLGDEVVLIGRQGEETISADEVATQSETINYEVVTRLMARVPRFYS
jgi:alanine racemase